MSIGIQMPRLCNSVCERVTAPVSWLAGVGLVPFCPSVRACGLQEFASAPPQSSLVRWYSGHHHESWKGDHRPLQSYILYWCSTKSSLKMVPCSNCMPACWLRVSLRKSWWGAQAECLIDKIAAEPLALSKQGRSCKARWNGKGVESVESTCLNEMTAINWKTRTLMPYLSIICNRSIHVQGKRLRDFVKTWRNPLT